MICVLLVAMSWPGKLKAYQASEIDETYSFENDFEGWTIRSNQAEPNLPPPVIRSQERATDGLTSLRVEVNRQSIFQTVWLERAFTVEPNQIYDVEIDYALASKDCCRSNPSYILTGVINQSPDPDPLRHELSPAGQGIADNGETTFSDYKWLNKSYQFTARTDAQGGLYVVIGITGGEALRSYFFDKLHIKITRRNLPCEFYSFETDLEGWIPKSIDLDFQSSPIPWSPSRVPFPFQDGQTALEMSFNNRNGNAKVWIERAFTVQPKKKYRIQLEYGLLSQTDVPKSRLIAGAANRPFEEANDLEPYYGEKIGDYDPVWKRYHHEFVVKAKKHGLIYVVIGIFARQENSHILDLDNVCVTVVPK